METLADRRPAAQAGQFGLDRHLVEEDQPMGLGTHARLALADPQVAGRAHIGALTLLRHQPFSI
ncbi:MAG: hypothetical protein MI785_06420 [Kiloniellales bacterium]|nr:hypothetical protein [Kiloniellales bacterium]